MRSKVTSTGSYLPETVVRNEDLTRFPRAALPLIAEKTGVRERRHAAPEQCTSDLAIEAGRRCLDQAGIDPEQIDGIVLSTSSPDRPQPATATRVQAALGARHAFAFDINSVCSGGVYALHLADGLIRAGLHRSILVVAAEIYSRYLNPRDFSTYPYFGDGAGAVLLTAAAEPGVLCSRLRTDGTGADVIRVPAGGTRLPFSAMSSPDEQYFKMDGKEVFRFAVEKGTEIMREVLDSAGLGAGDVDCFIPHQANINLIREFSSKLGVGMEKFAVNLDKYGNTASASVLIALDEARRSGRIDCGDTVVLAGFGGGLSWAGMALRV
jgi:3-oxoacyl-[acyl-carrier-protein] synthase III